MGEAYSTIGNDEKTILIERVKGRHIEFFFFVDRKTLLE
jgi:hypothetical protein